MKVIRLYLLKYKLAKLFKQAEEAAQQGIEAGDVVYNLLYGRATVFCNNFDHRYGGHIADSIPAMEDLRKLTIESVPGFTTQQIVALGAAAAVALLIGATFITAAMAEMYHGWQHLFHWMGM